MSIDDQLRKLTKNEMTVLYWKCKGLKYEEIGKKLTYSIEWVTLTMGGAYTKLGFSKEMHWTKRWEILKNEVCPRLPKNIDDWEPVIEITEGNTEEIREEPDPVMMALVLYDEKQIEAAKSSPITPYLKEVIVVPPPKEDKWKIFKRVFFAILSLVIILTVGYFAYDLGRGATPAPKIVVITATPIPATETPMPTATSAIPTNTLTPVPTNTQVPTNTPVPTEFVPPADGILFQDDFESGDISAWTQINGQWLVANGQLTVLGDDNDPYKWISLVRPEWKNYILSLTIYQPHQGSAAQNDVLVTVRNGGSQAKRIGVPVDYFGSVYWAFIGNDYFDKDAIAGNDRDFEFSSGSNMQLEVQGDTYILRVNGQEFQRITMPGYQSGGITLGADCDSTYDDCASFDNVKVTYLP